MDDASTMAIEGWASRARNAPSGAHRLNTTVWASGVSMRPSRPA